MQEEVAAFLEYKFEKIKLLKRVEDKKEIWLVKVKSTGENAVMKIITNIDENYSPPPYPILKKFQALFYQKFFIVQVTALFALKNLSKAKLFVKLLMKKIFLMKMPRKIFCCKFVKD